MSWTRPLRVPDPMRDDVDGCTTKPAPLCLRIPATNARNRCRNGPQAGHERTTELNRFIGGVSERCICTVDCSSLLDDAQFSARVCVRRMLELLPDYRGRVGKNSDDGASYIDPHRFEEAMRKAAFP